MNTMLDIENAWQLLPKRLLGMPFSFFMMSALFLFGVFGERNQFNFNFVYISFVMGAVGFVWGYYHQYRSACGTTHAVLNILIIFFIVELAALGSTIALVVWVARAPELRPLAVPTAALTLAISIYFGMQREARNLKWWGMHTVAHAKEKFAKQINFTDRTFKALPLEKIDDNSAWKTHGFMIACISTTNIPLIFQIFTGDRNSVIFFALPLLLGTIVYLNVKTFGRVLFNLILLRRLENSLGYRFINADYEQIQDLRRTFFLSRWLMKDYIKPTDDKAKPVKST